MPRFEVRQLKSEHQTWAQAILTHSNLYRSPMWTAIYPDCPVSRAMKLYHGFQDPVKDLIAAGLSYGVFDTEYQFRFPESAAAGGKLYWSDENPAANSDELLKQMDFPLVSVAMSYDAFHPVDANKMKGVREMLPAFPVMVGALDAADKRPPEAKEIKESNYQLNRGGTVTRSDYEGLGVMKLLSHFVMRFAASSGFKQVQIVTAHDAVFHVWSHPPDHFKAEILATVDPQTYEVKGEDGNNNKPLFPSKQSAHRVLVTLKI